MAQKYRKIDPRIWRDERFVALSESEKLVAIYCLTAQVNRCGIFLFSPAMAAEELGTSTQTFRERFGRVVSALRWRWDSDRRVLYLPRWWRYNAPENSNVLKGCFADLSELPETALLAEFYANLADLPESLKETFRERSVNVSGTLPQTFGNSGTGTGTGTGTGEEGATSSPPPPDIVAAWNALGKPFPQVRMTDSRKKSLAARWKDAFWRDHWQQALESLPESAFASGKNDRGWIADLEWFLKPDSVAKITEGKYANNAPTRRPGFQTHDDRVGEVMFGGADHE